MDTVLTIGSHSSLQILHGAKKEGFKTVQITPKNRVNFYSQFSFIDEILGYNNEDEAVEFVNKYSNRGALIPHGSLVEYVGSERVSKITTKIFGNRNLFAWESNQKKKMSLLRRSGIQVPEEFENVEDVDRLVIVKLPGAKGGKGYFIAKTKSEVKEGLNRLISSKLIKDVNDVIIQEYVIGVPMYFQFFYSPILNRLEITGIDIRYETNVDGLRRLPENLADPTFVVVGNIPAVARESLLPKVYDYGMSFVNTVKEVVPPGMIGPFCLESVVKDDGSIVVFEFSGRIVAGTNLYIAGSPYSWLYWDEPMSVGRRISREIRLALNSNKLEVIFT
ncbi:formate--phosphoribosylaminoimidazolecarboxamide ligase [Sulfolobus acidocaldarius]|uniref:5-formaminoimidazole-4-carboxamide-1-(beta)-D-ribofuranosyl 5'-monophosphate synthetase n=4 Tax=Sulfolobus acidocaldarius TaxID=2285 RepID=PURP_SULAC|nr:formate--phosphoribosylaminoimidazolecarboxamide ligase [Sulfolobus acidocaldarius]Q4JAU3.1 RecName: Full=5-formaminoimidazole-4-carboxamide-1-(beta)-D-ribofuranosyl 5'-monophosphate synthetase; AltName: Full=5-aminoimidazole-4-carboxamide-1-beta-D-ribofuranosyl 5'-monophosphate--formate ligase [Sulfolobus acidocaldarius DSM 639]AAY80086.1 conserved Archaeal protein [Sulfolobus acidocaldarius DSM 639]AGE70655.1 5-formaminoimidazole-4-carboxamide-1-(beta)-D-ribofuranosyl 5'-monophosphate synth